MGKLDKCEHKKLKINMFDLVNYNLQYIKYNMSSFEKTSTYSAPTSMYPVFGQPTAPSYYSTDPSHEVAVYPYGNPYAAQPTNTSTTSDQSLQEIKFTQFDEMIRKYEISGRFASQLRQLDGFKVVVICDDSGSMDSTVTTPDTSDYRTLQTRFQELKGTVSIVVEIASLVCSDGIDVYFLNRPPVLNVTNVAMLNDSFVPRPSGYTPIYKALKKVFDLNRSLLAEKKLLVVLATDGEPTDDFGNTDHQKKLIYDLLMTRHEKIFVSILACTDDDDCIEYLNEWDNKIPRLDVVDDFHSEKKKILSVQGPSFSFSRGDYVLKAVLGSSVNAIDTLDEICVTGYRKAPTCSIL